MDADRGRDRAELLDAALERMRAGATDPGHDEEMAALLDLARRLERDLPEDLPDPEFRARLKRQLLGAEEDPVQPAAPVDLAAARDRRRMAGFDWWRYGAAAAAVAAILVIGLVAGWDRLTGEAPVTPSPDTAIMTERRAPTAGATGVEEVGPPIPPMTADTLVRPTHGGGGGVDMAVASPEPNPTITWEPPAAPPDLPSTAPAYVLLAPEDPIGFLETTLARLGITGEIHEPAPGDNGVYTATSASGVPVLTWDPQSAYFTYQADVVPTEPARGADGSDPAGTARRWLEEIGFDLNTLQYEATVEATRDAAAVWLAPANLPTPALGAQLGVQVFVARDGTVQGASGYWLSPVEVRDLPLRGRDAVWAAVEAGEGVWHPLLKPLVSTSIQATELQVVYVLTRGELSTFVLQPAVEVRGVPERGRDETRFYVRAAP